jgi:AcrR family transcriptional regulator
MGRVAGLTSEQTRQRILDGAAEVFAEQGFEGARTADIGRAAGLSSGAMYNHFESKAELLAAVVRERGGNQLSALLAAGDADMLLDVLLAKGEELGQGGVEAPLLVEAVTASRHDAGVRRALAEQVNDREHVFAEVIRLAQTSGASAGNVDAAAAARLLLMILFGSLVVQAIDLPAVDPSAWRSLISRLIDGFRPEETR